MSRPMPKPGILDIAPYVPGKSGAGMHGRVFKLSANEAALGPSPKAVEAFSRTAAGLEIYPDGSARLLRESDVLDGENVLPGLQIPLQELFFTPS